MAQALEQAIAQLSLGGGSLPVELEHHGFVEIGVDTYGSATIKPVTAPENLRLNRIQKTKEVCPRSAAQQFVETFNRMRDQITSNNPDLNSLAAKLRRDDANQLLQEHGDRIYRQKATPLSVVTARGCLLRLVNILIGNNWREGDDILTVTVQHHLDENALIVLHGNPRQTQLLSDVDWYNAKRHPSGHLTGAILPLILEGSRDYGFSAVETMSVLRMLIQNRSIYYCAEVDGADDQTGQVVEVKTRVEFRGSDPERTKADFTYAIVQSILAGADQLWTFSHQYGKLISTDVCKVPSIVCGKNSRGDSRPCIAGLPMPDTATIMEKVKKALVEVEDLFARFEQAVRGKRGDIFHVNVYCQNGRLQFATTDFAQQHDAYYVRRYD
eukprot:Colp12_sorted_trinity150504_noHs@17931